MNSEPELEHVSCNLCGSDRTKLFMNKQGYDLVECEDCGLVYVNPRLPANVLAENVYGAEYFDAERGYGLAEHFSDRERERSIRGAHERLKKLERFAPKDTLLDVGCAAGYFLLAATQRGWSARGVEISEHAAEHARDKLGLDVLTGEFSSMSFESDSFDLITMLDVIEHLPDPLGGLRNAHAALRPNGRLLVVTPNLHGMPARTLGQDWGLFSPEHHIYYFTPDTLERMLQRAGFTVERRWYPLLGLNDMFLSAGALQKATGIAVKDERRQALREALRKPRDAARAAMDTLDRRLLAPVFAKRKGVIIEMLARKNGI